MDTKKPTPPVQETVKKPDVSAKAPADEKGGFKDAGLLEPTRYGDWDVKGRCSDF